MRTIFSVVLAIFEKLNKVKDLYSYVGFFASFYIHYKNNCINAFSKCNYKLRISKLKLFLVNDFDLFPFF